MVKILTLLLLLIALPVSAANRYVDKDDGACTDGGSGLTGAPFCTINAAMNYGSLAAGDHIMIRDASTAYSENAVGPSNKNGSSGSPIIIEPDTGHNPNITGSITILDSSWWTVRNLRFDYSAISSVVHPAIRFWAENQDVTGLVASGNTITKWGGTDQSNGGNGRTFPYPNDGGAISVRTSYSVPVSNITNSTIDSNVIVDALEEGVSIAHGGSGMTVSNNTISGTRCAVTSGYRQAHGIFVGGEGSNQIISGNYIHDLQNETDCRASVTAADVAFGGFDTLDVGIYCDVGDEGTTVKGNRIENISLVDHGVSGTGAGIGIYWESRCNTGKIYNNVINNVKSDTGAGIQTRGSSCAGNTGNNIIGNTVYNSSSGFQFWDYGENTIIKNNIFVTPSTADAAWLIYHNADTNTCSGNVLNGNLYYVVGGGTRSWIWNDVTTTSFTTWKSNSSQDANSVNSDPLFTSAGTDFTLTSSSPAKDAGITVGSPYNVDYNGITRPVGSAYDIGAYEFGALLAPRIIVITY